MNESFLPKTLPNPLFPPLQGQWSSVKKAYIEANALLGDIPKVTPSSKVVGDLAQFLVSNSLSPQQFLDSAQFLSLPTSVVNFFLGHLGVPPNGFPEPLTSIVRKGQKPVSGRPGALLEPVDFEKTLAELRGTYGPEIEMTDVMSYVLYPEVFKAYREEVHLAVFVDYFVSLLTINFSPSLQFRWTSMVLSPSSQPAPSFDPWKLIRNLKCV